MSAAFYAYDLTQSSVTDKNGNVYPKITGQDLKILILKKLG